MFRQASVWIATDAAPILCLKASITRANTTEAVATIPNSIYPLSEMSLRPQRTLSSVDDMDLVLFKMITTGSLHDTRNGDAAGLARKG